MTTKKKARAGAEGKAVRPREIYDEKGVQLNPLTPSEMFTLVGHVCAYMQPHPEGASLLLLLLYALSNEPDESDRANAYYEACTRLSSVIEGVSEAFEANHVTTLGRLREGSL